MGSFKRHNNACIKEFEPVYAKVDGKLHLKKHTAYKVFEIIRTTAIVCVLQMLDYHRNIADAFRQFISMFKQLITQVFLAVECLI